MRCWVRKVGQVAHLHPLAPLQMPTTDVLVSLQRALLSSPGTGDLQLCMVPEGEGSEDGPPAPSPWIDGVLEGGQVSSLQVAGHPSATTPTSLPPSAMALLNSPKGQVYLPLHLSLKEQRVQEIYTSKPGKQGEDHASTGKTAAHSSHGPLLDHYFLGK